MILIEKCLIKNTIISTMTNSSKENTARNNHQQINIIKMLLSLHPHEWLAIIAPTHIVVNNQTTKI